MNRPILTAAEMRAAEQAAIAAGTPVGVLMERAGSGAAEAIRRFAGAMPALVLCGPGNNGGDGYVVARILAGRGLSVRVAAAGEPSTAAARAARDAWTGPVEAVGEARPAPLLVDALFGTGLTRALDGALAERLGDLARAARLRVAIDLPSGAATDDGAILSAIPECDLTVTFAALKPSHLLQPAAAHMGRVVVADIGVGVCSELGLVGRPRLAAPGPSDHKYTRGYVAVVAGEMPGAAALAASAASRAGAGYVRLIGDLVGARVPRAVVTGGTAGLDDPRIGAIAAGPGLGRGSRSAERVKAVMAAPAPKVLDADALHLLGPDPTGLHGCILTPHEGEFARLFPAAAAAGSKVEKARAAARASGAVVVLKGADTVIADPGGAAAIAAPSAWLATAGTGDVLTGVVAARCAAGRPPFEAACEGVWLHARAAEIAGPGLIADDLLDALRAAVGECL